MHYGFVKTRIRNCASFSDLKGKSGFYWRYGVKLLLASRLYSPKHSSKENLHCVRRNHTTWVCTSNINVSFPNFSEPMSVIPHKKDFGLPPRYLHLLYISAGRISLSCSLSTHPPIPRTFTPSPGFISPLFFLSFKKTCCIRSGISRNQVKNIWILPWLISRELLFPALTEKNQPFLYKMQWIHI